MQAIVTRTLSPTDSRGTRVEAKANGGRVTRPYDHARTGAENHAAAARALADHMEWPGELAGALYGPDFRTVWVPIDTSLRA